MIKRLKSKILSLSLVGKISSAIGLVLIILIRFGDEVYTLVKSSKTFFINGIGFINFKHISYYFDDIMILGSLLAVLLAKSGGIIVTIISAIYARKNMNKGMILRICFLFAVGGGIYTIVNLLNIKIVLGMKSVEIAYSVITILITILIWYLIVFKRENILQKTED